MNIEEARKVIWLKSNPRTLGKLLDEGYLTKERLKWAAQWAYNPRLQEAAKVLLNAGQPNAGRIQMQAAAAKTHEAPVPIGISLDQARATPWPLPPYKGQPIGILVESKQLSLKDLGYAAENAWEERVRQAAIALSLVRLEQVIKEPTPSAGFVHINSGGRSYSERQQSWLTFLDGLVTGLTFAAVIFLAIYLIRSFSTPHPEAKNLATSFSTPIGTLIVVLAVGLTIFVGWLATSVPEQISKRLTKQIEEYRRGQEGEDRVVELIIQALDGNWHLFRNISLPGRNRGDLDLVLVGPPGVWVLEVKNLRGEYRNIEDRWEYRRGKRWTTAKTNPSRQVRSDAIRLANFLKADHLNLYVNDAVVWANQETPLIVDNPSVAVWIYQRLADELGNIWQVEKLSKAEREKITAKLSRLIEQASKKNQSSMEAWRVSG
jgi:hypothetical protein